MQLYCLCGARFYRLFSTEQQPHMQIWCVAVDAYCKRGCCPLVITCRLLLK